MIYSTGIQELDEILGGGLPAGRGYMLSGKPNTGKRLLALTIQKRSLERGEYCLYITHAQSYKTIMDYYRSIGVNPEKYMKVGLLKITDYYSLDFFKIDEINERLSPIERENVIFMLPEDIEDEEKRRNYLKIQQDAINKIEKPGVVIIDSLTERLQRTSSEIVLRQWKNFRERLSKGSGLLALHLYTPLVHKDFSEIVEMFHYFEDGTIQLDINKDGTRKIRCLLKMPPSIDNSWYTFIIRNNKILIQKITKTTDPEILEKAIIVSKKCRSEDERIHPKVGVVIIKDDQIICDAYRGEIRDGEHAEYTALERKCVNKSVRGATLITTLEPCTAREHPKRSGKSRRKQPCVKHIIDRGIKKVVIGMLDPNKKIRGEAYFLLKEKGKDVEFFPPDLQSMVWNLNKSYIDNQRKS